MAAFDKHGRSRRRRPAPHKSGPRESSLRRIGPLSEVEMPPEQEDELQDGAPLAQDVEQDGGSSGTDEGSLEAQGTESQDPARDKRPAHMVEGASGPMRSLDSDIEVFQLKGEPRHSRLTFGRGREASATKARDAAESLPEDVQTALDAPALADEGSAPTNDAPAEDFADPGLASAAEEGSANSQDYGEWEPLDASQSPSQEGLPLFEDATTAPEDEPLPPDGGLGDVSPAADEPLPYELSEDVPLPDMDAPNMDMPAMDAPATDVPDTDVPSVDASGTDAPAVGAPAMDAPTAEPAPSDTPPADDARAHSTPSRPSGSARPARPKGRPHVGKAQVTITGDLPLQAAGLTKRGVDGMVRTWDASIRAFGVVLAVGFVVGCLWFLRPTTSDLEKRTLTTFPELTWSSLADGTFTSQVGLWYSDTFPFRDQLMAANRALKASYGIQTSTQMVGEQVQADAIPEEGTAPAEPAEREEVSLPDNYTADDIQNDIQGQIMQGLYVKDGAAYSAYGFSQDNAQTYAAAINGAYEKLGDGHEVYSVLIPNNSGALLSEDELASMGGSDQGQAISYIYSLMDPNVRCVPTYDTLREHNSEYIYFRTDHHWTALGAYYVYRNWCEAKGIEPHELDQFEELDLEGFLGSFYSELQLDSMAANPDTVQAWIPMGTNDMQFTDTEGTTWDWHVIQDIRDWASSSYYLTFIGGDRPWSHIHNPQIDDGSSCVVVKESYGNCFVPWLVDHYEDVYVIDFRYATVDVVDYMQENDIKDLIVINNITIATGGTVPAKIASIL